MNIDDKKGNQGKKSDEKAEDFLKDHAKKVHDSQAFTKFSSLLNQFEDFMEDKAEKFQRGGMAEKLEALKNKAEEQTAGFVRSAREAGRKFGSQVDASIDKIKGKKDPANFQNGGGI